jgi:hypothetical protein
MDIGPKLLIYGIVISVICSLCIMLSIPSNVASVAGKLVCRTDHCRERLNWSMGIACCVSTVLCFMYVVAKTFGSGRR